MGSPLSEDQLQHGHIYPRSIQGFSTRMVFLLKTVESLWALTSPAAPLMRQLIAEPPIYPGPGDGAQQGDDHDEIAPSDERI